MAKNKPGLPDGFDLDVKEPTQLGDYLDEDFSSSAVRAITAKKALSTTPLSDPIVKAASEPVVVIAPQRAAIPVQAPQARNDSLLDLDEARRRATPKAAPFKRPARKQFNMKPETIAHFLDFAEFVQRYSVQDDVTASEILDALINVLHDAKQEMTFNDVPRRGRWGTPTAKAFPTSLGNAFARAIALRYAKQRDS